MALTFSEGSIGGDIETINLDRLRAFYDNKPSAIARIDDETESEPGGSNGIAVAPSNTKGHHALLLINPHTSFIFAQNYRGQVTKASTLTAQRRGDNFSFIKGFNEHCGWMHTSSAVDAIDEYLETISKRGDTYLLQVWQRRTPGRGWKITVPTRLTTE
jgi:acyl-homoserine-lactone acylase